MSKNMQNDKHSVAYNQEAKFSGAISCDKIKYQSILTFIDVARLKENSPAPASHKIGEMNVFLEQVRSFNPFMMGRCPKETWFTLTFAT